MFTDALKDAITFALLMFGTPGVLGFALAWVLDRIERHD